MKAKKIAFTVNEKLYDDFSVTCRMKGKKYSHVIEEMMRNYIITNKVEVKELVDEYLKNNNEYND